MAFTRPGRVHGLSYVTATRVFKFKMAGIDETERDIVVQGKEAAAGNDVAFMDMVKEFSCIYNRGSAQLEDRKLKLNAWRTIGKLVMGANDNVEGGNEEIVQPDITASKHRYEMRTLGHCSRYLKKINPPPGSGSDGVKN